MTTATKPTLPWMPYQIVEIPCDNNRQGFLGRGTAMIINGQPCVVMTRGQLELENIGNYLSGDQFDKDDIHKVTLIETDEGIMVRTPEEAEELPINLPAAEHESPLPDTTAGAEIVGKVPMYEGRPVAKYITPHTEFVEDITPVVEITDENRPIPSLNAAEDDDEL